MVFLNLRSGSKAVLLFHSKHASRRRARSTHDRASATSFAVTCPCLPPKWAMAAQIA
jgi:hypothetical protein